MWSKSNIKLYLYVAYGCEVWPSQENTSVSNGRIFDAYSRSWCRRQCYVTQLCNGLDWIPSAAAGQKCRLSGPWSGSKNIGTSPGVTHYVYNKNCLAQGNNLLCGITGSAVAIHCVKAHRQSQRIIPNFNP